MGDLPQRWVDSGLATARGQCMEKGAGISIRSAFPEDAEAVTCIYVESWNEGFGDLMRRREVDAKLTSRWRGDLVQPGHRWWVAERDGAIVGFVGIGPSRDPVDPSLGELNTIAVDPSCWRTGIGQALMSQALRFLSADGYLEAVLWTLAGYPQGAGFYRATGWSPNGAVGDGGRQVCYTHPLESSDSRKVPAR